MADVREMPERDQGDGLTVRQRRVLEVIRNWVDRRGYPPSLREIGEAVGLTSPSSVAHQLAALERKGYLRKDPNRPRALEVLSPDTAESERGYRSGDNRASVILGLDAGADQERPAGQDMETGSGDAHRRRRPDPRRAGRRGRLPAPATARRRGAALPAQGRRRLDGRRGDLRR